MWGGLGILGVVALGALALSWLARGERRRPWGVCQAVLLGSDGRPTDLRFACFVVAVLTLLAAVALRLEWARGVATGELILTLGLTLPLVAGVQAGAADLLGGPGARLLSRLRRARREEQADLRHLLDEARHELDSARELVTDPGLLTALDALEEAARDYASAVEEAADEETLDELRVRIEGVGALTRSCLEEDHAAPARVLGVRADASAEEVEQVYQALCRIYEGEQALAGVDPDRRCQLEAAYRQLIGA